jgi:hypothetical protein
VIRPASIGALILGLVAVSPAAGDPDHLSRRPAAPAGAQQVTADSIRYSLRVTDNNLVGVTITNYGFVGNNFVSRAPSLEYPLGTAFEHLVRGGLWIGARAIDDDGAFTGVSTAAEDGSQGNASQGATEYTPAGLDIQVRSTLPNDRFFNPVAVSEQDFVSTFSDRPSKRIAANEAHRTMNLLVRQENYQWSFSEYAHTVIFHYVITNLGLPIQDAWVGFYTEFASGPKNLYSTWPPSSAGSTIGSWFNKKWIAYDDSLRLSREHYCAGQPVPQACNAELVPPWIGVQLLGVSPGNVNDTLDKKVTFAAWDYDPGSAARDEDRERYAILSSGLVQPIEGDSLLPGTGDPVQMLAVGPFPLINPGDSIYVDFAIVGGISVERIQQHARFARRAFDRGYIVPVPPPSPRFRVIARSGALDFYWDDSAESFQDPTSPSPMDFEGYRVYISEDRQNLNRVAQFDKATAPNDTTGFNTGLDVVRLPVPEVIDGVTYQYKYTVSSLKNGFKYYAAVTSYDLGNTEINSLESGVTQNKTMAIPAPAPGENVGSGDVVVFPNPYRVEARWDQGTLVRDHYLWFANLPERCTIRIYTLSGDLVFETDFDGATYQGQGTRGIYDPNRELDVDAPTLSGRSFGWNLISKEGQAVATGLYLYSVEANGDRSVGKFLIVKSDREDF